VISQDDTGSFKSIPCPNTMVELILFSPYFIVFP
jgi:hypothetical protein